MASAPHDYSGGMRISNKSIERLRAIYREQYGEEISFADAHEMGERLITLYRLLMQPVPDERASQAAPPAQTERGEP